MATKTVLVTGDHGVDYDIFLQTDEDNPPPGTPPTIIQATYGGAGIVHRVLAAAARPDPAAPALFDVGFVAGERMSAPPTAAIWAPFDLGALGATPAEQKARVWRTRRSINLGNVSDPSALPKPSPLPSGIAHEGQDAADVLAIEDDGAGFRTDVPSSLMAWLEGQAASLPSWIVLKTCAPVCHGVLWWALVGRAEVADRLIVVVSISDLRRAEVRVSQGISWERSAEDLVRELVTSPALSSLRQARHVIVTLHSEGAVWMERQAGVSSPPRARLFFDPANMEGEWSRRIGIKGNAYGFHAVFAASLATRLAIEPAGAETDAIAAGIERGLLAMRALRVLGHGPVKAGAPALPATDLAGLAACHNPRECAETSGIRIQWSRLGAFGRAEIPSPGVAAGRWRMLEATDRELGGRPMYGKARRVALAGTAALENVPHARFGRLFTADRDEIEALRNLKCLMEAYADDDSETKPLSLAVFGPPGAGKSFGIKQIAETAIEERRRAVLEFNLSQFDDPTDLIGAFHQVRDRVLDGKLPLVFWDEFDAQDYRWLQFLLAPMQDGRFQEGQITHPIGRCVFVFAGATSYTCEDFGPPDSALSDTETERERHRLAVARFRLKKGPDFKSRLHGFLNVLGPNPRQRFNGETWEDDPTDVCFPVRRAILLRSMLGLMGEATGRLRLEMDPGVISAMIEVGHYRHGSRSFEKIAGALRQGAKHAFHRSALPSDEVLAMNVDSLETFKRLLDHSAAIQPHVPLLAAAIHARWLETATPENIFRKKYEELPPEAKADNIAAALRIPDILGLVGLELVPTAEGRPSVAGVDQILRTHLETLADEEHRGWMEMRIKNGWRPCERAADPQLRKQQRQARLSDCLVPYGALPEEERDKDRGTILWYQKAAALVGLAIVAK